MDEPSPSHPDPFLLAVIFEGGLGLVAIGLGWLLGDPPAQRIDWTLEAAGYGLLATIPLAATMWLCMRSQWGPFRHLLAVMEEKVNPVFAGCRTWELAGIAIFAGFGEEVLFRGVLQNLPANLFDGQVFPYVGLILASVLFGLLHWLTLTYAILAALIGLYLGGLWMATGNLLVPAVAHAVYDFWALVYLLRFRDAGNHLSPSDEGNG
jgi:uncharacterized protein